MDRYINQHANLLAEHRLLKIGFLVLLVATLVNAVSISRLDGTLRTHVIPIGAQGEFVLSGRSASDDYLQSMMQYIVFMVGNLSSSTARVQLNDLLGLFHGSNYGEYKDEFKAMADTVENYSSIYFTTQWRPDFPLVIEGNTLSKKISRRRVVGNSVTQTELMEVRVTYLIEHGRFWITDFSMEKVES